MVSAGRITLGILLVITVGISITQVGLGIHYVRTPIQCEGGTLVTSLILIGGLTNLLSMMFLACCCYSCAVGMRPSTKPEQTSDVSTVN